ncbi:cytochrome P450 4c3-like [Brevipalpus obovatus]|uniref:cytochrome P450 4c3-like n=1 Tax=Brevipalpus obovatus TaxID=246614 RepID=UPI003D9E28FE
MKKMAAGAEGMVSFADDQWKLRRNIVAPFYSEDTIQSLIPIISHHIGPMLRDLSARGLVQTFGCQSILSYHILLITLKTSFGLKNIGHPMEAELIVAGTRSLDHLFDQFFRFYTWSNHHLKLYNWFYGITDERAALIEIAKQIVKMRLTEQERNPLTSETDLNGESGRNDQAFLDYMLEEFMDCGVLTNEGLESLVGELLTMSTINFETILDSVTWFLHNMACNQSIQMELYHEIVDFDVDALTYERIDELTFFDQCIRENLRIRPPIANVFRMVDEDVTLDGHVIPKGILSVTFIYSIHHDENIYPEPEKFDPSRFAPENITKIPPGAYIPFGNGPRRCIGEKMALLESKIILLSILKKFWITPVENDETQVRIDLLTRPKKPLKLRFTPRF